MDIQHMTRVGIALEIMKARIMSGSGGTDLELAKRAADAADVLIRESKNYHDLSGKN